MPHVAPEDQIEAREEATRHGNHSSDDGECIKAGFDKQLHSSQSTNAAPMGLTGRYSNHGRVGAIRALHRGIDSGAGGT